MKISSPSTLLLLFAHALACAFLLAASVAMAGQPQPAPLRFGVVDVPPYGDLGPDGEMFGLHPKIIHEISRVAGVPVRLDPMPFPRAALSVRAGAVDAALLMDSATTDGRVRRIVPVLEIEMSLQPQPGLKLHGLSAVKKLRIGRITGGCHELDTGPNVPAELIDVNSHKQAIALLLAGRIDAFCSTSISIRHAARLYDPKHRIRLEHRLKISDRDVWLMVRSGLDESTSHRLQQAVLKVQHSGFIRSAVNEVAR